VRVAKPRSHQSLQQKLSNNISSLGRLRYFRRMAPHVRFMVRRLVNSPSHTGNYAAGSCTTFVVDTQASYRGMA